MPRDQLWGGDRFVLYLPAATQALEEIDGSREMQIKRECEKFLDSPKTAWDKHPEDHVWQVRSLKTNTRAFATWCQNREIDREAFIIQDIYKKAKETEYWDDIDGYDDAGKQYEQMFSGLAQDEFDDWVASIVDREGITVVFGD